MHVKVWDLRRKFGEQDLLATVRMNNGKLDVTWTGQVDPAVLGSLESQQEYVKGDERYLRSLEFVFKSIYLRANFFAEG